MPRIPRPLKTRMLERVYLRDILRLIEPARDLIARRLLPILGDLIRSSGLRSDAERLDDDYAQVIGRTFGQIRIEYERLVTTEDVTRTAKGAASQTELFNRQQINRQFKQVLGIDVLHSASWLQTAMGGFATENVKLITSIPGRYLDDVELLVMRGVRSGMRVEDLAQEIQDRYPVAESRAALIARDQIGKFNGQLNALRNEDLGLSRYRWRNSQDERVRGNPEGKYPDARPSHWAREGKIYRWSNPPEGGNPGEAIQCRCWGEPVFEDILGEEFAVE